MMNKILTFFTLLFAIVFILVGLGWLLAPEIIGEQMGMELLDGKGLTTQIGDLASFFITLGSCILLGLKTDKRIWLYPPIMMLFLTAFGRIIAWLFHGAALTIDMIAVEVLVAMLLYVVSTKLSLKK